MHGPHHVPSPLELLVYFGKTGNVGVVSYLLRQRIPTERLSPQQVAQVEDIQRQLHEWVLIEKQFGPGASLNLSHKAEIEELVKTEGNKGYLTDYLINAERYREVTGENWLWSV